MQDFWRILRYLKPYRKRFLLGIICSFFVSIFNGLSLTALKPIFDVLETGGEKPFQLQLKKDEIKFLCARGQCERIRALFEKARLYEYDLAWLKRENITQLSEIQKDEFWQKLRYQYLNLRLLINEKLLPYKAIQVLIAVAIITIPVYLLKLIFYVGTVYFISSAGLLALRDIRRELYQKVVDLPVSFFVREKTGILMSRIINDVSLISEAVSESFRVSINNFFIIITHIFILAMISVKLLLLTMIGIPLFLLPVSYFSRKIKSITTDEQTRLADLNGHLQEVISGIRVIRAFGMEKYEQERFEKINHSLYKETFRYRFNHALGPSVVEFATSLIVIALVIYGGVKIIEGEFTSGSFFLFLFTLLVLISPIKQMANWYNLAQRAGSAGKRIFEIIDMPEDHKDPENPIPIGKLKEGITFRKVSFRYPNSEKWVLRNINFSVKKGTTVALVGHSGAGKSTLVDLIPRFYDPEIGEILLDGIDIKKISLKDLRAKIGVVTQDIFLFNGTIKENIAYGRQDIPMEKIMEAARLAYADEFIRKLPLGYDTPVGERGLMLSGGQRQRISIARALLKNPEILILDEATSALDTTSERLVQKALDSLMKNRTTFVIAHRLSTIYHADLILVIDKGRIVEKGTHKELLAKKGLYRELYQMQFQQA